MNKAKQYQLPVWLSPDDKIDQSKLNKYSCLVLPKRGSKRLPEAVEDIYLSGGMEYAKDYGLGWRDRIVLELDPWYKFFNPPAEERGVLEAFGINANELKALKKWSTLPRAAAIVSSLLDADKKVIDTRNDSLAIYWDESIFGGGGSAMEVGWANARGIPVFLIIGKDIPLEKVSLSVISKATHVFTTLEGFIYHMKWAALFEINNQTSPIYKRPRHMTKKLRNLMKRNLDTEV